MPWITDVHMTDVDSSFRGFPARSRPGLRRRIRRTLDRSSGIHRGPEFNPRHPAPVRLPNDFARPPGYTTTSTERTHRALHAPRGPPFKTGAVDEGMSRWKAWTLWAGLRLGGWAAW